MKCTKVDETTLLELITDDTRGVEFIFDNVVYRKIYEVAMGSPLTPTLANIFMGFIKGKLYFLMQKSPCFTVDMSMIHLPSSGMRWNAIIFS